MHATDESGRLKPLGANGQNTGTCWLKIGDRTIYFDNLPDLGDSKGASYNDEPGIGRSMPIKTFATGEKRSFPLSINLFVQSPSDIQRNLFYLRTIQAAVYPRKGNSAPYLPPIVCQLKCGELLSSKPLCVIMTNYSVKFPTDVPWDEDTMLPYKLEISMELEEVRPSSDLPGYETILEDI
jgi:hypothetical protein